MDTDELIHKPLSDEQIKSALGLDTRIIKYNELKQYDTIHDLLPNNGDFVVIFIQWSPKSIGHWVMCYKWKDKFCYFNPYGNKFDKDLNVISRSMRRILGEQVDEFHRLTGGKMEYSKKRFQKGKVDTCGRWIIMRASMLKMGYSQKEFENYMKQLQEEYPDLSTDQIVCMYVTI